jgi:hypothetical protein
MSEAIKTILGGAFFGPSEEDRKRLVWTKGRVIPGYDPAVWRHDDYGRVMRYADYGCRSSEFGWEIDHISPLALGGGDHPANLRPLHCKINAGLGGLLGAALKR